VYVCLERGLWTSLSLRGDSFARLPSLLCITLNEGGEVWWPGLETPSAGLPGTTTRRFTNIADGTGSEGEVRECSRRLSLAAAVMGTTSTGFVHLLNGYRARVGLGVMGPGGLHRR
jgi:hypothetical protein